jgi:hypothetical protein
MEIFMVLGGFCQGKQSQFQEKGKRKNESVLPCSDCISNMNRFF